MARFWHHHLLCRGVPSRHLILAIKWNNVIGCAPNSGHASAGSMDALMIRLRVRPQTVAQRRQHRWQKPTILQFALLPIDNKGHRRVQSTLLFRPLAVATPVARHEKPTAKSGDHTYNFCNWPKLMTHASGRQEYQALNPLFKSSGIGRGDCTPHRVADQEHALGFAQRFEQFIQMADKKRAVLRRSRPVGKAAPIVVIDQHPIAFGNQPIGQRLKDKRRRR